MSESTHTVFYSWQSDTKNKFNRTFIEEALEEAIRRAKAAPSALEPAPRPEVSLDRDTQGVPGSPPIVETILKKIDACSVFVADLTFVGRSAERPDDVEPRHFPNPNVLIEYGYALSRHGHARLVGVINLAFGGSLAADLPFDLRHLRWPITYSYGPDSKDRAVQFENLVKALTRAIGDSIANARPRVEERFVPADLTLGQLAELNRQLLPAGPLGQKLPDFILPTQAVCTLRVHPVGLTPALPTEFDALDLVSQGHLRPMAGNVLHGISASRNRLGAVSYQSPTDGRLRHLSQLLLSRELVGVDADAMAAISRASGETVFDPGAVETTFAITLDDYVRFARTTLGLAGPLVVSANLHDVMNYAVMPGRASFRAGVEWRGEYSEDVPTWRFLRPFYEHLWKCFGCPRPQNADEALLSFIPSPARLPPLKKGLGSN